MLYVLLVRLCTNTATFNGPATFNSSSTVVGTGDNVTHSIKNNTLGQFTSLYLNNISGSGSGIYETGQIHCGNGAGLSLVTNTAHPIKFTAYNQQPNVTVPTSIQILANSTRDVEILTPLKVKGSSTIFDNGITVGGAATIASLTVGSTLISNTSVAWSSGNSSYHYLETGGDALVIRTPSGTISANFLGNVGGTTYDGKAIFYKDVDIGGNLVANGNMQVGLSTANKNLTIYGNTTISGSCTVAGNTVQRAISNGNTASGETALFVNPIIRTLKAGTAISLTTDTTNNVVTIKANLTNYGSGTGVQYLLDAGNQAIKSILPGNSIALADSGGGSVYIHYKPYISFRLTGNAVSTTVNHGQVASTSITIQAGRVANTIYTFTFPTAHPNGANYMIMVTPNTSSTSSAFYICSSKVESSTSFSVWCRTSSNAIIDGDFFVYTIP